MKQSLPVGDLIGTGGGSFTYFDETSNCEITLYINKENEVYKFDIYFLEPQEFLKLSGFFQNIMSNIIKSRRPK